MVGAMKVTFLTWEYPPNVYGGAGVHVQNLVQGLKNKIDIEVRTLLPNSSLAAEMEETGGIRILRYPGWEYTTSESKPSKVLSAFSTDLAMVKDPIAGQIVHAHTWYTSLAGYYAKHLYDQKLIMTVHSLEPLRPWKKEALGNGYLLSTWAEKIGLEACDRIIAVSNSDKKDIIECYRLPPERIKVIPNGVDEEAFHRHENHAVLTTYGIRKPYALFLGRLSRQKGIFDLISASSKLDGQVTLVIVTGAPDEEGLDEKLSKRLKGLSNIIWINKMLPQNEVIALLSASSVFVAPSLYEPFGIMNLEAMACERPVVSTRVGGITDVVLDGETGLLVPPNNPDELSNAVNRIVADPKLSERMGEAGRRRVEDRFTWDKVAMETLSLYNEVTG
jgi:starch synthase